jgi:ABC-type uncharacterized transport system involved in gliding motility auxiliary subunit
MKSPTKTLFASKRLQLTFSIVLITATIGLLGWVSHRYQQEFDWTFNNRNSLTQASQKQLALMKDAVEVRVFIYPDNESKRQIQSWFDRYKKYKKNLNLTFINPSSHPELVKQFNVVQPEGEVIVSYQGRRESLTALDERSITEALQRLGSSQDRFVVFLEGHGERNVSGGTPADFDKFAQALKDKGLKVQPLNLAKSTVIPDNTAVLVIASPTSALLAGEVALINDYVQKGGNLVWLADPDVPAGLEAVAQTLGIQWQNGFAVFPNYRDLQLDHPGYFLATDYPKHPLTQGLEEVTVFPLVRGVTGGKPDFHPQPFLQTSLISWLENQALGGSVDFDPKTGDIGGPLTVGLTLDRELDSAGKKRLQRVVLIGDTDFLSNGNLEALGNQKLGVNVVQWASQRDSAISIDVPKAPDLNLSLSEASQIIIALWFVLLTPLLLLGWGVARWWFRRRQ